MTHRCDQIREPNHDQSSLILHWFTWVQLTWTWSLMHYVFEIKLIQLSSPLVLASGFVIWCYSQRRLCYQLMGLNRQDLSRALVSNLKLRQEIWYVWRDMIPWPSWDIQDERSLFDIICWIVLKDVNAYAPLLLSDWINLILLSDPYPMIDFAFISVSNSMASWTRRSAGDEDGEVMRPNGKW